MDPRKLAAEMKAKALADLKAAEEMERAAEKLVSMAAEQGWQIDIKPANLAAGSPVIGAPWLTVNPQQPAPDSPKRGGKAADPNSTTSRSKTESIRLIREKRRPIPLGELIKLLAEVGVVLGGKNPNQALSANLGHCPELESTKRGWWLAGEPLPAEDTSPVIGRDINLPGLN
ncbi:hypothetical protein [Bradyrhizobium sp. USDA 10063]